MSPRTEAAYVGWVRRFVEFLLARFAESQDWSAA